MVPVCPLLQIGYLQGPPSSTRFAYAHSCAAGPDESEAAYSKPPSYPLTSLLPSHSCSLSISPELLSATPCAPLGPFSVRPSFFCFFSSGQPPGPLDTPLSRFSHPIHPQTAELPSQTGDSAMVPA